MGTVLVQISRRREVVVSLSGPLRVHEVVFSEGTPMARMRSAICSHPSRMWITVARGESLIRAKKSFALVVGKPWSQVTSCMLSRRPSPRIASVFAARSPISVVVSSICSFFSVGTRSHRRLMTSCACDLHLYGFVTYIYAVQLCTGFVGGFNFPQYPSPIGFTIFNDPVPVMYRDV